MMRIMIMRKKLLYFFLIIIFIITASKKYILPKYSFPKYDLLPGFHMNELNIKKITISGGKTFVIRLHALNKRCTYSSSDYRIAYADKNGRVHTVNRGYAVITVKTNTGRKYYCYVHVI